MAKLQGRSQVLKVLKDDEILEGVNINFKKELGRGSYATVYQAEWRSLSCVAKVFHDIIFPSHPAETWKQLAREIEFLQHIRHPNIVQLLGFTETHSKIPSVIMERLDTNLTTLIKEHHSLLSFDVQVCILHDVAVGLNFLHAEPIIHRDLSSNNILLTEHLVAKISDLGLAKHIKSVEQQAGSFAGFGTQDYMPPEVLGQKPPLISPKTDVFSFGVVMLQVATGKPPDVRGRLNVDAEADRRKRHLDLLGENNLFHPLVLQCLNNESDNRPTAVKLCEDLKRLGIARMSTLKLTKALQEVKVEFKKQLEALQLQRDSDIENMQKQLQEETMALQAKLNEEKAAAVLRTKELKAELNVTLDKNIHLEKRLKETENKLHAQLRDKEMLQAKLARAEVAMKKAVQESTAKDVTIKKSGGMLSTSKQSWETALQTSGSQEHFMPAMGTTTNNKSSPFSSGDHFAHPGQKLVQPTSDAAPYGDATRLVGDKHFGGGICSANMTMSRENDLGGQKPGINLQNLGGIEDAGAQERVRALQEKLLKAEQERDESKRNMERSNAVLNNRIRCLEEQLNITSVGNEAGMVDEIKKLNVRISELESTEHMMKESSSSQSEIERQYHRQLQQLEQKCVEQKIQIVNLEAICAMQQGESFEETKKELEKNKAVSAQLQARIDQLQMDLQVHDVRYKQVVSYLENAHEKQTDLLEESRAAMTRSMELTEENAKLHEQNFNLVEDMKSLKEKLQQQGGAAGGVPNDELNTLKKESPRLNIQVDNMASPSDDDIDVTTCPLCYVTLGSENELQLHYLQSCPAYSNEVTGDPMSTKPVGYHHPPATQQNFGGNFERSSDRLAPSNKKVDNMATPSDDDVNTCPLCRVTLGSGENELQLHYLQSCAGYDNEVAGDPMSTKPVGHHHPPATQQNFGGNFERSSDRLAPSNKKITVDHSRAAVGGDGNLSGLSQRLVKFVWYPNDPFKVHEQKATLLSSFTAGKGSVRLFKDKNDDIGSYSSSTVSVRIGKFDDAQIVVGEEMWEVEPYVVSNDSEEIYLITEERNSPGPPSALKQPTKRTAKSVTKQVETGNGKQEVLCEPVSSAVEVKKGQRVVVCRSSLSTECGTVRAVNVAIDAAKKGWIGVEMDLPSGDTAGEVKGVRHFKCKPKHAVFVPPKNIFKIVDHE